MLSESQQKEIDVATEQLCTMFAEEYIDFVFYYTQPVHLHKLIILWKPFIEVMQKQGLDYTVQEHIFNTAKEALLNYCKTINVTISDDLIKRVKFFRKEYREQSVLFIKDDGVRKVTQLIQSVSYGNPHLQHHIILTDAKDYFEQLKKLVIEQQVIPSFSEAHPIVHSNNELNKLFENLKEKCLILLNASRVLSTDLIYVTAYHLLCLAQHWLDSFKKPYEGIDLNFYEEYVTVVREENEKLEEKWRNQTLADQFEFFEKEVAQYKAAAKRSLLLTVLGKKSPEMALTEESKFDSATLEMSEFPQEEHEEDNKPQQKILPSKHEETLSQAKDAVKKLEDAITVFQKFSRTHKKLNALLNIFAPAKSNILTPQIQDIILKLRKSALQYFEEVKKYCLIPLEDCESTDADYIIAYRLLCSVQSQLDSNQFIPPGLVTLEKYKDRAQKIQDAWLNTSDSILPVQLEHSEEENPYDRITQLNNFLTTTPLTYRDSRSELKDQIVESYKSLAENLKNELVSLQYHPVLKSEFILLWKICISSYEQANFFTDGWIESMYALASLYKATEQLIYAKKCYSDVLWRFPEHVLEQENLALLEESSVMKKQTITATLPYSELPETLKKVLAITDEADTLSKKCSRFNLCVNSLETCHFLEDKKSMENEGALWSKAAGEKYEEAKTLLNSIKKEKRRKLANEIKIILFYLNLKMATIGDNSSVQEENVYHTLLNGLEKEVDNVLDPVKYSELWKMQYDVLLHWASFKGKVNQKERDTNEQKRNYEKIGQIYQKLLENFKETDNFPVNLLIANYKALFQLTEKTIYKKKAIEYAEQAVIDCLYSNEEPVRNRFAIYVKLVETLKETQHIASTINSLFKNLLLNGEILQELSDEDVNSIELDVSPEMTEPSSDSLLLGLVDAIIQSPDFLALLLRNGYTWQKILGKLRSCPYDDALVKRFERNNQNDALAFLLKKDEEMRKEIQEIPLGLKNTESMDDYAVSLENELKIQPYSISIIYQLIDAYLQQNRILRKEGSPSASKIIEKNLNNIASLQIIFGQSLPDLFCRVKIEQLNAIFFQWQRAIQEEKTMQLVDGLMTLIGKLCIIPPPNQEKQLQTLAEKSRLQVSYLKKMQFQYWRNIKELLTQLIKPIEQSDDITQKRFYHIMILCYKQRLRSSLDKPEEEIENCIIRWSEEERAIDRRLAQATLSFVSEDYLCIMHAENQSEIQEAANALAEQYHVRFQEIYGNWQDILAQKATLFDENDICFSYFKTGVEELFKPDIMKALPYFQDITIILKLTYKTSEKLSQLYHDAYFILADAIRHMLAELNKRQSNFIDCFAILLWDKNQRFYLDIVNQKPRSPYYNIAKEDIAEFFYRFGEVLQRNNYLTSAKNAYEKVLQYNPNHDLAKNVLRHLEPLPKALTTPSEKKIPDSSFIRPAPTEIKLSFLFDSKQQRESNNELPIRPAPGFK